MDKKGTDPQPGQKPGIPAIPVRPGGSGEGSRSALEELIQRESRRVAQRPRDAGDPARADPGAAAG